MTTALLRTALHRIFFLLAVTFFISAFATRAGADPLNVVTTTEDIASLVRVIGGGQVTVHSLTRGYQDAHFVQAKPSLMLKVHAADRLIYQGLDLETGWLPLLIQGARNPNVFVGQPGNVDLSLAVDPIQIPTGPVDRSMGDVHPFGNPHYPLGPGNIKPLAYMIADKLAEADPAHAVAYKANRDRFMKQWDARLKEWNQAMQPLRGARVVTFHRTWGYLLKYFGLHSIGTVEIKPGVQPTPSHLSRLAERMKKMNVRLILQANYFPSRFSHLLAEKTGGRVLMLPAAVGGIPEAGDTLSLFDYLVRQLTKNLKPHE